MSESLDNEFDELIKKMRENLKAQFDAGEMGHSVYYQQLQRVDELVDNHDHGGWQNSGCSWQTSNC